jgi:hypothetical protein
MKKEIELLCLSLFTNSLLLGLSYNGKGDTELVLQIAESGAKRSLLERMDRLTALLQGCVNFLSFCHVFCRNAQGHLNHEIKLVGKLMKPVLIAEI